jgi:hypothetical protein
MQRRSLAKLGLGGALAASITLLGAQMTAQSQVAPTIVLSTTTPTTGQTIMLSGSGWDCTDGGSVTISIGGLGVITTVTPDSNGGISVSFAAPLITDSYIAVADGHNSACGTPLIASFTVAATPPPATTTGATTTPPATTGATTTPSTTVHAAGPAPITPQPIHVTG